MDEEQREYFRNWRVANIEKARAAQKRYHEEHGKEKYYENLELTRAIKRKSYYVSVGKLEKAAEEQAIVDELRKAQPKKQAGAKEQFIGEKKVIQRRAVVRKSRYGGRIKGIPTYHAPDKCEICGGGGKICLDHCHKTGVFRGWLCNNCNLAIAYAQEDLGVVFKMMTYLSKHKGVEQVA